MKPEENARYSAARIHLVWGLVFVTFAVIALCAYKVFVDAAKAAASRAADEFHAAGSRVADEAHAAGSRVADEAHAAASRLVDETKNAADRAIKEAKLATAAAAAKAEQYAGELAAFTERAAAKFKTGQITETFRAEIPVFRSLGMGRLEVSVSDPIPVTFGKSDKKRILWDWVYLGQTVSEIRVPATYRYYVPLDGNWEIRVQDKMCIVVAPTIRPSLPVAIDTGRMEKQTASGWARFDKTQQLDALELSITRRLGELAVDSANIAAARNEARETIANFVSAWLMRERQWGDTFTSIIVVFPEEPTPKAPLRPTLQFQPKP